VVTDGALGAGAGVVVAGSQVGERGREKNRVEKLLEDAGIKLSVVASDIFGVSGRAMMNALIAGERDPQVLAQTFWPVRCSSWRTRSRCRRCLLIFDS